MAVFATAVQDVASAHPCGSMLPAASLGYMPTGFRAAAPGGVACAPPPTTIVPGGHVTVTLPTAPDGTGAFTDRLTTMRWSKVRVVHSARLVIWSPASLSMPKLAVADQTAGSTDPSATGRPLTSDG